MFIFSRNRSNNQRTKPRVDRTNEIKWTHEQPKEHMLQFQERAGPDPNRRQDPPRQYDPEVNRRVKLRQYEVQAEVERNQAQRNLNNIRNREIGQPDQDYYERKKRNAMQEAQRIKRQPEPEQYQEPAPKPANDPYQVKSYGAPTSKLKEQLDKQGMGNFPKLTFA